MANRSTEAWYPTAAYLYVLHLDGPALAWEYLRRNPDYRRDWLRRRHRPDAARAWGLCWLDDPARDAREAHPAWFSDPDSVIQLYADADPPPDAVGFVFWRIPGQKSLIHDGKRLMLAAHWPGGGARFALAPGLADGMAYVYALRARAALGSSRSRSRAARDALPAGLDALADAGGAMDGTAGAAPAAAARARPTAASLLELHTLQALDATLAGASLREVAEGLFGADAVANWYSDGGLRSKVRRLTRRGESLMRGGYRRLAQLAPLEEGRFDSDAKRP